VLTSAIKCGADKREVSERLREISQTLAPQAGLFGIQPDMVGVAQHLFKHEAGSMESLPVGQICEGSGSYQPKGANIKGAFSSARVITSSSKC